MNLFSQELFAQDNYVAHEWGTFTSLVGSDGIRQPGMYHEDEILPNFVHRYGEDLKLEFPSSTTVALNEVSKLNLPFDPNRCSRRNKACEELIGNQLITQKMETPVLYFYSTKELGVKVDIAFPGGVIAESYPKAVANYPEPSIGVKLINGFSHYDISILSPNTLEDNLLKVEKDNIYSHARIVKSNLIKSNNEVEKFIFYRGLGDFTTQLKIQSLDDSLIIKNTGKNIPNAFLINFDGENGEIKELGHFATNEIKNISNNEINKLRFSKITKEKYIQKSRNLIKLALISSGLYEDEAVALLNTWEQSYLKNAGLRVLYILNREEVESILPMNLTPAPRELKRVFVGRVDILTQKEETVLLNRVLEERNKFNPESLGRLAHPIANRLLSLGKIKHLNNENIKLLEELVKKAAE